MTRSLQHLITLIGLLLCMLSAVGCAGNRFEKPRIGVTQRGIASWYGEPFHGRKTANGETYDMYGLTAAHKELPLGTVVDVKNLDNGKSVTVRVNDRGPFIKGRVIDMSYGAAKVLGMVGPGTAKVALTVVELGAGPAGPNTTTRFTVQVGAFKEAANAERLRDELGETYSEVNVIRDGPWHRVHVGRYSRHKEADRVAKALKSRGLPVLVVPLR